jgi:hypothetical protein
VKAETNFTDCQVLNMSLSYSSGPLYGILFEGQIHSLTIDEVHPRLLDSFIPVKTRENLKRELVTRPQKIGEPLKIYFLKLKRTPNC